VEGDEDEDDEEGGVSITRCSMEAALKAARLAYEADGQLNAARAINIYYEQGMDEHALLRLKRHILLQRRWSTCKIILNL
jgi:hypothetical protein